MSYIITTVHKHFFYQMFCKNGVTIALFSTKNIPAPSFLWGSGAPYALTALRAARAVATRHREPRHAPTPPQPNPSCTVHRAPNQPFIREERPTLEASEHQACDPTVRGICKSELSQGPRRKKSGWAADRPRPGGLGAKRRGRHGDRDSGAIRHGRVAFSPHFPTPDLFKFDSRVRYQLRFTSGAWEPSRPRAEPTAILLSSASAGEGDVGSAGDLPTSRLWFLCRATKLALVHG